MLKINAIRTEIREFVQMFREANPDEMRFLFLVVFFLVIYAVW